MICNGLHWRLGKAGHILANILNLSALNFVGLGRAIAFIQSDEVLLAKREFGKRIEKGAGGLVGNNRHRLVRSNARVHRSF